MDNSIVSPYFKSKKYVIVWYCLTIITLSLLIGVVMLYFLDATADAVGAPDLSPKVVVVNNTTNATIIPWDELEKIFDIIDFESDKLLLWAVIVNSVIAHLLGLLGAVYEHFGLTVLFGLVNTYSTCVSMYTAVSVESVMWIGVILDVLIIAITFSFAHDLRRKYLARSAPMVDSPRTVEMRPTVPAFSDFGR